MGSDRVWLFAFVFFGRLFTVGAFVPLIEHRGHAAFPFPAPVTVMSPSAMPRAEEDESQQPEEQEDEEDREADAAGEEAKVMRVSEAVIAVTISVHRRDDPTPFSRMLDRFPHLGGLGNSLRGTRPLCHISAR